MEDMTEMKVRRRLSELDKRKIMELKIKGFGSKRIASTLQLNPSAVKTFIHRHGKDPAYVLSLGLCACCGSPLVQTPGRKSKKFCSDACRMKWWADHRDELNRTMYTNQCEYCGRSFETANAKQKYCGRACYAEIRRKST